LLEQATIVFNIGAIYSQQALSFDRSSPGGIQSASKSFLRASGTFESMAATMALSLPDNPDIASSSVSFLSSLMLAQAAALSFESAVLKPMAPAVLAVLATGVAETYSQAMLALRSDSVLLKWIAKSDFANDSFLAYQIGYASTFLFRNSSNGSGLGVSKVQLSIGNRKRIRLMGNTDW
jgi:programmed cell death 6-interacting protein